MATPAHRLIKDQNLTFLYTGTTPGGKTDVGKADKKGGLGGRKALNDISNSRKPSVLHSLKDNSVNVISIENDPCADKAAKSSKAPGKGKVGGRKALSDLTNSVKPPIKQVPGTGRKLNAVTEENVPSCIMGESFLHNHQECIKAQTKTADMNYFLQSVGLSNDIVLQSSARSTIPFSSKKLKNVKHLKMEEIPEHLAEDDFSGYCSPACRSPRSPKAPCMSWGDDDFSNLTMIGSPMA